MKIFGILFFLNLLIDIITLFFWLFFKFRREDEKKRKRWEVIDCCNDLCRYLLIISFILYAFIRS